MVRHAALVVGVALFGTPLHAQRLSLDDLLDRAGSYVVEYHQRLAAIVAEEHYVQRSVTTATGAQQQPGGKNVEQRTLRSDFMLLPGMAGEEAWFAFRDIFEVDGQPVSSQRGRLEEWLSGPRTHLMRNARALALEQARYNLGPITRTINVPTLALEILMPARQERFRFRRTGTEHVNGIEATVVIFEERRRPTMIRTPEGRDLRARGTLWMEPASGRVVRTELRTGERGRDPVEGTIVVEYAFVPRLDLLVPVRMDERYTGRGTEISCAATYSNFRRFETEARIIR
jgi:hypothetical protein